MLMTRAKSHQAALVCERQRRFSLTLFTHIKLYVKNSYNLFVQPSLRHCGEIITCAFNVLQLSWEILWLGIK